LEAVCNNAVGRDSIALDMASLLAETLLDDFFDLDQDDEGEDVSETAPAVQGNQFVFGAPVLWRRRQLISTRIVLAKKAKVVDVDALYPRGCNHPNS
jgi:hypothetical protein